MSRTVLDALTTNQHEHSWDDHGVCQVHGSAAACSAQPLPPRIEDALLRLRAWLPVEHRGYVAAAAADLRAGLAEHVDELPAFRLREIRSALRLADYLLASKPEGEVFIA